MSRCPLTCDNEEAVEEFWYRTTPPVSGPVPVRPPDREPPVRLPPVKEPPRPVCPLRYVPESEDCEADPLAPRGLPTECGC